MVFPYKISKQDLAGPAVCLLPGQGIEVIPGIFPVDFLFRIDVVDVLLDVGVAVAVLVAVAAFSVPTLLPAQPSALTGASPSNPAAAHALPTAPPELFRLVERDVGLLEQFGGR